ncbi:MAG: hypothetical protein KF713_20695 [Turneriella sp.]|nr:hypothetical protein [Turneriella sp.]
MIFRLSLLVVFASCSNDVSTRRLLDNDFDSTASLIVAPESFTITVGQSQAISVRGGKAPYSYQLFTGGGSVSTGGVYSSGTAGRVVVQVSDSAGAKALVSGRVLSQSLDPANAPGIAGNLKLWLKADALVLSNGAAVTTWPGSGGTIYNGTAGGTAPVFVTSAYNGRPAVRFSGPSNLALAYPWPSQITMILVATPSSALNTYLLYGNDNVRHPTIASNFSGRAFEYFYSNASTVDRATFQLIASGLNVLTFTQNASTYQLYFNTEQQSNSSVIIPLFGSLSGISHSINPYTGDVAELIIFDSILSVQNRYAVECYLIQKYGITSNASCQ